jgi:hypothetical protein
MIAGVVGLTLGERVGGMLLAFPAILPATLTLIANEQGEQRSFHDLQGTVAGAFGLVAFGVIAAITIGRLNVLVALGLSLLAWCALAGSLYLVWATWLRRVGSSFDPPSERRAVQNQKRAPFPCDPVTESAGNPGCSGSIPAMLVTQLR